MNESTHGNPEPYRTPGDIPSVAAKTGLIKSPWAWIFLAGVLAAIVSVVAFARTSLQEFGENRAGPPREMITDVEIEASEDHILSTD